ncbi:MAG: hypothetical protein ACTSRP_22430 [Candidatus Helarchaeota archaeon]
MVIKIIIWLRLVFSAHLILCWAQYWRYWNYLEAYSDDAGTIGAKKEVHRRYCKELFPH